MNVRPSLGRPVGLMLCWLALVAGCSERGNKLEDMPVAEPMPLVGRRGAARPVHPDAFERPRDASDRFFEARPIVRLKLLIDEPQSKRLREEPRQYVRATLIENDETTYPDVAVKLKGAAGSFQGFDDRPALTINSNKYKTEQTFHRMDKFHLNNSVQDETYACESICADLSHEMGVPASRVAHARVWINDRDMGLYVLKEGFDRQFLRRHFAKFSGNLYDGGFLLDVDADLERDAGDGPSDFSDLKELLAACREPDPDRRWALMSNSLEVNSFLNFVALELMTCHWDGYTRNRNNYRIYFDPADGKARFMPHGMDQMFSDPGFGLLEFPETIVGASVMQNPTWRKQYRQTLVRALPLYSEAALTAKLDAIRERLSPILAEMGEEADRQHAERCQELRDRLIARAVNLREQVKQPEPAPVEFDGTNPLALDDWEPRLETEDTRMERVEVEGGAEFVIEVGPSGDCVASWRRKVFLAHGRYRLVGQVRTKDVDAIGDEKGIGAGLRISGTGRKGGLSDTSDWKTLSFEFEVAEPAREVELVAELRATRGLAAFRAPLRIERLQE